MAGRTRSFWHWGFEEDFPDEAGRDAIAAQAAFLIPALGAVRADPLPERASIKLHDARIAVPASLARVATINELDRAMHAGGKGYRDILRAFRGDFSRAPD